MKKLLINLAVSFLNLCMVLYVIASPAFSKCNVVWQPPQVWSADLIKIKANNTLSATWIKVSSPINPLKIKGVTLIMAGLNNHIETMKDLANFWQNNNYLTVQVALSGHRGIERELGINSAESWKAEWWQAYQYAAALAQREQVPLYFVGFSLGALIHTVASAQYQEQMPQSFAQQFLFAPALSLNKSPQLFKLLLWLPERTCIPSFNLIEYQANDGTPLRFYKALYQLLDELGDLKIWSRTVFAPTTTLFVNKSDELINVNNLRSIERKNWQTILVDTKNHLHSREIYHLIIDEASVGSTEWQRIKQIMYDKLELK